MGEECVRSKNSELLGIGDTALVVAILCKDETSFPSEIGGLDRLASCFIEVGLAEGLHMLWSQGRRDECDVEASAMGLVPGFDQLLAGGELLIEAYRILLSLAAREAGICARMWRTCRADSYDRARTDFPHAFAMSIAIDRVVRP